MKKIKILPVVLLICLLMGTFAPPARALDEPAVEGTYCVLLETNTDTVLYQRAETERAYPASLTKMMTVLLAVEAIENQTVTPSGVTASPSAEVTAQEGFDFDLITDGSTASILLGETMPLEDLLYCAMLSSANEACNIIAQFISGSIPAFVELMNQRASELGCTGTHFANTHGLPDENHYTTAWDLTLIAREAIAHPLFREICGTRSKTLNPTNLSAGRELYNTNSLINTNDHYAGSYLYDGCAGIKTGFTSAAGYCLASVATRDEVDNIQLLSIVLHSPAYDENGDGTLDKYCNFTDTSTLFDWGFDNWSYREILKTSDIVAEAPVSMADGTDTVSLRPSTSIVRLLPNDDDLSGYRMVPTIYAQSDGSSLEAPISAGTVLGEIAIVKDGKTVGTSSLVATTDVNLSRLLYMRTELRETLSRPVVQVIIWALVLLFVGYLTVVARYRAKRRRYLSKAQQAAVARAIAEDDDEVREWYNTGEEPHQVRRTPPKASAAKKAREKRLEAEAEEVQQSVRDEQSFRDYFEEFFGQDQNQKK